MTGDGAESGLAPKDGAGAGVRRILVVDDDPLMCKLMGAMLCEYPAQVRVAGDVAEARAAIGAFRPQLVFLDVALAGPCDGLDLCRELKAAAGAASPLVIMISGHNALADIDAALRASADGYLLKPFSAVQVEGVLDAAEAWLLGSPRPFRHYWPFDRRCPPPAAPVTG
ncbi:response regulator [Azoarcus sp. DN11]|uniref:response regulator n=1 Tax=Azoarcus sp. DN11 TaxID=356837 RepID=UPI0013E3568D|nr:response regulator [Azoarcus sp. DN11]